MNNMRCFTLVCLVVVSSCHPATEAPKETEKGFIDWINSVIGGRPTTTILPPTQDPPDDCPSCQCGVATRSRIVGGYETQVLELPWMAALLYNGRFFCGGSLINDLYVLTAAHCATGFRKEKMTVRLLEHDRSQTNETKTIDRKVRAIIVHLRYNPSIYDNDIALLKLDERVDLSKAVKRHRSDDESSGEEGNDNDQQDLAGLRPVCLPTQGLSYSNYSGLVSGWGTTSEGGQVSNSLQEVYVPIMSNAECRQTAYKQRITDNMLCAGEAEGGRDACQGDSGGPLHILNKENNVMQEVGIVSWGEGCARPDRPGVYTRVNRYLTWLRSNTRDACYCTD